MASYTESYAQPLRVIGQALEALRINAFTLEKNGDKYLVCDWETSFLKSVSDEVRTTHELREMALPQEKSENLLIYTNSDAELLEKQGRSRRGSSKSPDTHAISSGLRVVGHYLDKKGALTFNIQWSIESIIVKFEAAAGGPKESSFTMQNLKDLAVVMYLRRSRR